MCYFDCGREPIGTIESGDAYDYTRPYASVAVCGDRGCALKAQANVYGQTRIDPGPLVTFEEWRARRARRDADA